MNSINKNDKWIFLVPVDGNANKNTIENKNQLSFNEKNKKNDIKIENDKDLEEIYNNDFFDTEKTTNIKKNEENQKNVKIYSTSLLSKDISIADSSKIYMSEFLKKNWKIKIKRLIIKLKKRYTKQVQKSILEEGNNTFSNVSNKTESSKFIENYNSINFDDNWKLLNQSFNNYNQIINNDINNINFQNYNNNTLNISKNQQNYHNSDIKNNNIKNKEKNNFNDDDNF